MALVVNDRVQQTGTANTTVSFTLSGSVTGYQSFSVIGNGNTTFYGATDTTGNWEVGIGTYATGGTLTRTTILASSNSGSAVTFSGTVTVFVTYPSEKSVNLDASGNVSALGTITSAVWNGTTIPVAYGGTGVTTSSGANSVVLRDSNSNITTNNTFNGYTLVTAAGGTTTMTAASTFYQKLVAGTGGQTFKLPDATTLPNGATYIFDNDSTGTLTIQDSTGGAIDTITAGALDYIYLESNGTVAGSWGQYAFVPASYDFNTTSASFGNATISNAVWNGTTIASGYGGTGLTTFTAANNALYSTSSSALAAGTLPVAAGGTAGTTAATAFNNLSPITTTGDLIIGTGTNTAGRLGIGTSGYVLQSNGTTASWASPPGSSTLNIQDFTATSGQTSFTLTYTVGLVEGVYRNGIKLGQADYTATSGTAIVLGTGAITGDLIQVVYFTAVAVAGLGTMSTQNANAVAVTGGTIDNAVIGGTTPAAGTFTTITGQTEVLKGTGQNLVINSQVFTSSWNLNNLSATSNTVTAPDSTSTGSTLTASAGTSVLHQAYEGAYAYLTTASVVFSIYAKAGTNNYLAITVGNSNGFYANFNVSNGTVGQSAALGTGTLTSATATSVGNGWYRLVIVGKTVDAPYSLFSMSNAATYSADGLGRQTWTSVGTETVYIWGAQLEYGTSVSAYTVTTSSLIFNQPTISFNNAAQIGMEYNGNLYLQPNGTGAIQAQATTSSTVGGNARGANAVDWQTVRSTAGGVANGSNSVIGGGAGNFSSSGYAVVAGGLNNGASGYGSIVSGGSSNAASAAWTFVGASTSNTASGQYGSVVCGNANTASGYYGFVGNGFTNSTTTNAAVTTQSGTMNATTAVTLSGSNASIKVGQYITGTSIAGDTYVAAISGTALTLSKNASGSSTSTLSFFTPHGVVVGGGNNQATGSYSVICGGGDAGTAANRNVASGDWSFVGGGKANISSGQGSFVGAGGDYISGVAGNNTSGLASAIVAGFANSNSSYTGFLGAGSSNTISAVDYAVLVGGNNQAVNGAYSAILGGRWGTTRSISGNHVFPACVSPIASAAGVSQAGLLVLGVQTTDATATVLRSTTSAASGTNQVIMPDNSAYYFKARVIAGVTGAGNTKAWTLEGAIKRGSGVGTAAIVGTVTTTVVATDAGAATWTVTATADTTNGGLAITVTGQASTTIRWVCKVETAEMTY
jgi:hypothetical protein